jgi:hypothetical protein
LARRCQSPERTDINYQFIDNFSWKLTRHDLKFGYEFAARRLASFSTLVIAVVSTSPRWQIFLPAIWGVDAPRVEFGPRHVSEFTCWLCSGHVSLESAVTLNLGLRWDYNA